MQAVLLRVVVAVLGCLQGDDRGERVHPEVRQLISSLHDRDSATRGDATVRLSKMGADAAPAAPHLVALLSDRSPGDRTAAIVRRPVSDFALEALVAIGPPAVEHLFDGSKNTDATIRGGSMRALGRIAGEQRMEFDTQPIVRALLAGLGDGVIEVRIAAARGARRGGLADADLLAKLEQIVDRDSDSSVRVAALSAATAVDANSNRAVRRLITSLSDDDVRIRAEAIGLLGEQGTEAAPAVDALVRMLDSDDALPISAVPDAPDLIVRWPIAALAGCAWRNWRRCGRRNASIEDADATQPASRRANRGGISSRPDRSVRRRVDCGIGEGSSGRR